MRLEAERGTLTRDGRPDAPRARARRSRAPAVGLRSSCFLYSISSLRVYSIIHSSPWYASLCVAGDYRLRVAGAVWHGVGARQAARLR